MTPALACDAIGLDAQVALNRHFLCRLGPPEHVADMGTPSSRAELDAVQASWMAWELSRCSTTGLPQDGAGFVGWYRALFKRHLQDASGFFDYLAEQASLDEMAFYVCLEEQVDGRFDDVIALAQVGLAGEEKLALARNYWDEMGSGQLEGMHTRLFGESAAHFRAVLQASPLASGLSATAEAIRNGNLLMLMALDRRHAVRLLGALTLLEHTAPHRFAKAVAGMRRLGVPPAAVYYHEIHIEVDARHGDDLLHRIVAPLAGRRPDLIAEIAIGMQVRCNVAGDYYRGMARQMGVLEQCFRTPTTSAT